MFHVGGGARSRKWTQLKADVLNTPMTTVETTECGCLGVAMLGCSAKTGEGLESLSARWTRTSGRVEPNPENAARYAEKFEIYRGLYPAIKKIGGAA